MLDFARASTKPQDHRNAQGRIDNCLGRHLGPEPLSTRLEAHAISKYGPGGETRSKCHAKRRHARGCRLAGASHCESPRAMSACDSRAPRRSPRHWLARMRCPPPVDSRMPLERVILARQSWLTHGPSRDADLTACGLVQMDHKGGKARARPAFGTAFALRALVRAARRAPAHRWRSGGGGPPSGAEAKTSSRSTPSLRGRRCLVRGGTPRGKPQIPRTNAVIPPSEASL